MSGMPRAASASASLRCSAARHHRTCRVVRRVDEYRARAGVHGRQHAIRGLREALRGIELVLAHAESPGARHHRHRGIHGLRNEDGGAGLGEQAGERHDRFGRAGHHEHVIRIDPVQRGDPLAQ